MSTICRQSLAVACVGTCGLFMLYCLTSVGVEKSKRICNLTHVYSLPENVRMEAFFVKPNARPDLLHLPNLTRLEWPIRKFAPAPDLKTVFQQPPFEPQMSPGQLHVLLTLLDTFAGIMQEQSLADQWFIAGGSLLGSMRHHDLIPWDEDFDLLTDISYRNIIQT